MLERRLADFVPERLTQARQAAGLNMTELAEKAGLVRQAISSFENGDSSPSPSTMHVLARELNVEPAFFVTPLRAQEKSGARQNATTFRTLASSTKRDRNKTDTLMSWLAGLGEYIEEFLEMPPVALPDFGVKDFATLKDEDIEELARRTRREFGLGDGPITDLTLLLENKGVYVAYLDLPEGFDGVSAWIGGRPVVLICRAAKAVRARFDLAHELGHLILHRALTAEALEVKGVLNLVEKQANYFAGSFLLPGDAIANEIYAVDERSLLRAKERWGVSMQAILVRLATIGLISEWQKVRAFQRISAKGYRRQEPLDDVLPVERARLFKRAVAFARDQGVLNMWDFFEHARYPAWFVEVVAGVQKVAAAAASTVLPFRLKTAG